MENIIGRKLDGRYEIQEIIGVGGMAIVYKAYDSIDDRVVAVKVLKDEFLANEDFKRRFKNESKAISVLSHPNIVKVYDVSFGEKMQYIVMEYIDGITLKEYIDQQKVLTWKETVHFTVQILRALEHAHARGIVHRDIKPQNIMMLEDGTIKVADFGIARIVNSETRTITDKAIGSVHYISPEQARGDKTDEKSDIYSVGVMMYEMLTGSLPFESDNAVSVAIMQMQQSPRRPRELNDKIPEGLEDITLRAMQKDPADRYASAADMLADIERFKNNPSIRFEYKYFVDESPTKYVDAISKVKAADSPAAEPQPRRKKKTAVIPKLTAIAGALVLVVLVVVLAALFKSGFFGGRTQDVTVPDLVGQNYNDVRANPTYASKFKITQETTLYSDTVPKDDIISQNPEKGAVVKKNSTIKVKVSLGPNMVTIPDNINGMDATSGELALKQLGLQVSESTQNSDSVAKGTIISIDPPSGTQVKAGSTVAVVVSAGVSQATVPDLSQVAETAAQGAIEKVGLKAGSITEDYSDTVAVGKLIKQTPAAGTMADKNTTVSAVYSKGPQPASSTAPSTPSSTTVPNLRGYYNDDAVTLLTQSQLKMGTVSPDNSDAHAKGYITTQSPSPNTAASIGSSVNVQESSGMTTPSNYQPGSAFTADNYNATTKLGYSISMTVDGKQGDASALSSDKTYKITSISCTDGRSITLVVSSK